MFGIEEGKKPRTIAGVCFFMAIMKTADDSHSKDENLILSEISDAVKIEVNTIINCYRVACEREDLLLPKYLQGKR